MKYRQVNSSMISAVGYDKDTRSLRVQFKNHDVWEYSGVDEAQYNALLSAKSVGSHFHKHIKGKFEAEKI